MNRQIREDFKENTSAMKQEAASLTKSSAEPSAEREPAGGSAGRGRPRRNPRRILSDLLRPPNTKCVSPSLSHLWDSKEPMVSVKNANTRHGDITRDVPSYVHVSGNRFAYYNMPHMMRQERQGSPTDTNIWYPCRGDVAHDLKTSKNVTTH